MEEKRLFFRECRAAGLVFKDMAEWQAWLDANKYDVRKAVAEHYGFQYNINDVCINPNVKASYRYDVSCYFEVRTARTQFGWIWGYDITLPSSGSSSPACYPSRYDDKAVYLETEDEALVDALSFVVRVLEGKRQTKNVKILLYYAKKWRMETKHPQLELFK